MKRGCVSIVLPAYNCENEIKRAINSVIQQTYQNWELVIVNDCSTDHTWSIISGFHDQRILAFSNRHNEGLAQTRNNGLKKIHGEYLAYLDADDWFDKNFLKKGIDSLSQNEADVAVYDIRSVFPNQSRIIKCDASPFGGFPSVWNKLYKTDVWGDNLFDKNRYIEDFPITPVILLRASKIVKVNQSYYNYEQRTDSLVHSWIDPSKQLQITEDVKCLLNELSSEQIAKYNQSLAKYVSYQLSEHFWKGIEDSQNVKDIKKLYFGIAVYSKQLNQRLFHNYQYFLSDSLYHSFRNSIILRLFSAGMFRTGKHFYIFLLDIKNILMKSKKGRKR